MTPRTETFYRFAGEVAQDLDTAIVVAVTDPPPACRRDDSGPLESFVGAESLEPIKRLLRSGLKSIHIAGVSGDVGRDAILLSLARTLAETGRRILVVDADVDGPPLAEPDRVGLTDVMSGDGRMAKVVVPSPGYEGMMAFLPIGRHADTLESPGAVRPLVRALEEVRPSYDVTLVSAPCLDRRGKVHPAATACEAVLLVLSPTLVSRDRIRRNFLQLWGVEAPLRGLVTLGIPNVMAEVLSESTRASAVPDDADTAVESDLGADDVDDVTAMEPPNGNGHDADVPIAGESDVEAVDELSIEAVEEPIESRLPVDMADAPPLDTSTEADTETPESSPAPEDAMAPDPTPTDDAREPAHTPTDDAMAEFERVLAEATEATRDAPPPAKPKSREAREREVAARYSLPAEAEPTGESALHSIEARARAAATSRGHRDPEQGAPMGRHLSSRQRLALGLLTVGVVGIFAVWFWPSPSVPDAASGDGVNASGNLTPAERLSERGRRAADPASGVVVLTEDAVTPGPKADETESGTPADTEVPDAAPPATENAGATGGPPAPARTPSPRAAKSLTEEPAAKTPAPAPSAPAPARDERTSTGAKVLTMTSAAFANDAPFYAVHITSFRRAASAETDAARLAKLTELVGRTIEYDIPTGANQGRWYRVIMGQFDSVADAERAATRIKRSGITDYARVYRIAGR